MPKRNPDDTGHTHSPEQCPLLCDMRTRLRALKMQSGKSPIQVQSPLPTEEVRAPSLPTRILGAPPQALAQPAPPPFPGRGGWGRSAPSSSGRPARCRSGLSASAVGICRARHTAKKKTRVQEYAFLDSMSLPMHLLEKHHPLKDRRKGRGGT